MHPVYQNTQHAIDILKYFIIPKSQNRDVLDL